MGRPFLSSQLPLPMGNSGPRLIHGSWANPCPQPKGHLDRFSRFCRARYCDTPTDSQTYRLTDHDTRSVTVVRIYVHSTAMRPNNNVNKNRKPSIDVAPTTSATFYPTPNFQFAVTLFTISNSVTQFHFHFLFKKENFSSCDVKP